MPPAALFGDLNPGNYVANATSMSGVRSQHIGVCEQAMHQFRLKIADPPPQSVPNLWCGQNATAFQKRHWDSLFQ